MALVQASWHDQFKHSAYVFAGGLSFDLTEGDLLAVFSQYGEILDVHLVRDKDTGKSRGFAFLAYEDQRSTNLAVDNLSGASSSPHPAIGRLLLQPEVACLLPHLLHGRSGAGARVAGRIIRVEHVNDYKKKRQEMGDAMEEEDEEEVLRVAQEMQQQRQQRDAANAAGGEAGVPRGTGGREASPGHLVRSSSNHPCTLGELFPPRH